MGRHDKAIALLQDKMANELAFMMVYQPKLSDEAQKQKKIAIYELEATIKFLKEHNG